MNLDISALYRQHCKELLHHLLRIVKCQETAEDLVQESYLILARTANATAIENPRSFLYRTASNLALDHLRHNKIVERHQEAALLAEEPQQSGAESEIASQQCRTLLYQTIAELPPRCRDAFILHKIRGLSYREVAGVLDISESAVEKHIVKGLVHCRKQRAQLAIAFLPTPSCRQTDYFKAAS
ncbi:RNA polymerase sigma factor [Methylomonas methanica]|jgi:RNA polymerase sigma-70 factor (ECF subfamily)|uniref:RNA polymerase subunit sigma-24 n=1 Tax=Methylomonas methanica TaxID=421 RepID=A0A177MBU9_METMH|nr:sigma-70 family RNA polymerase sigma factor [Methylomonas methanica]OAI02803.1 RNA polymerase subunit sigma-24 [Methylomonas methanica]